MAKKKNDVEVKEPNKINDKQEKADIKVKGKKKKGVLFLILLILSIIALIRYNAFNITEKYLRAPLEKIPIVKNILPAKTTEKDPYLSLSQAELISKVKEYEQKIKNYEEDITKINASLAEKDIEIKRLQEFENQQLEFKTQKEEFDKLVALSDTKSFKEYYEAMYPESADSIYKEIVKTDVTAAELKKYTQTYGTMESASAADILEIMSATDSDLVILILNNIDVKKRAEILAAMTKETAAIITKKMAPNWEEVKYNGY